MRALGFIGGFWVCLLVTDLHAQEPARPPCWDIILAQGTPPYSSILLDRCTGKSWLMVRQRVPASKPPLIVYRWVPLLINDGTEESSFLETPPPPTIIQPR